MKTNYNRQSLSKNNPVKLCVILPCYNEEEILNYSSEKLKNQMSDLKNKHLISADSFVCFVDDGSRDTTWSIIEGLAVNDPSFSGIKLSNNFGHQNALIAGLFTLKNDADCFITIDADLQDDITVFEEMLIHYYDRESKIVYGVRDNRENDTFFKRFTAQSFYKLMDFMNVKTVYNHADFRLADKIVVDNLERFNEVSLFLRGIFPVIGFKHSCVYYKRNKRVAGETKYPLYKMMSFAWKGITSFSTAPLRMIFYVGIIMFLISIALGIWVFASLITGHTIQGWASTLLLNLTFSGFNMMCLGIIGEYIGKIYQEIKSRPRFIIEKKI